MRETWRSRRLRSCIGTLSVIKNKKKKLKFTNLLSYTRAYVPLVSWVFSFAPSFALPPASFMGKNYTKKIKEVRKMRKKSKFIWILLNARTRHSCFKFFQPTTHSFRSREVGFGLCDAVGCRADCNIADGHIFDGTVRLCWFRLDLLLENLFTI